MQNILGGTLHLNDLQRKKMLLSEAQMRRLFLLVCLILTVSWPHPVPAGDDGKSLPPYPMAKERQKPESNRDRAWKLFDLASRENRTLKWDECLAGQAVRRATEMVQNGRFEHRDPETGRNPAWAMVAECGGFTCAGENLSRGRRSALATHNALMDSPSHRKNILDPRFRFLGVGCYEEVCVQLFAGY